VSDTLLKQLSAKVRNVFSLGYCQKHCDDGKLQVRTVSGRIIEKRESFPYGFAARAKNGRAFVLCQGGSFDGFEIMPLIADDSIKPPELQEGDAALYTEKGGWVVAREDGTLELFGKGEGGVVKAKELESQLNKLSKRVDGIMDALKNSQTASQDGGATYKAQIVAALAALSDKENFANLENAKVLHGTGK
jgi:phage gp45-like